MKKHKERIDPVELFLGELESSGKSSHTVRNYGLDLKQFQEFYGKQIEEAVTRDLKEYFLSIRDLKPATRARKQASLSSFFGWCVESDILETSPMDKVKRVKIPDTQPRPIPTEALGKVFRAIEKGGLRDRLLFNMLRETGMRVSEALTAEKRNIKLEPGEEKILVKGKGSKERSIPLSIAPKTMELLQVFFKEAFSSEELFKICYRTAHELWSHYCKAARIDPSEHTIHALRHTFATDLINKGVELTVVGVILGHVNPKTTMRYGAVTDNFVKEELARKLLV